MLALFKTQFLFFVCQNMEKSIHFTGDEEYFFCELPNLVLKSFAEPPPMKFANLSEQELNQLVEQRHS